MNPTRWILGPRVVQSDQHMMAPQLSGIPDMINGPEMINGPTKKLKMRFLIRDLEPVMEVLHWRRFLLQLRRLFFNVSDPVWPSLTQGSKSRFESCTLKNNLRNWSKNLLQWRTSITGSRSRIKNLIFNFFVGPFIILGIPLSWIIIYTYIFIFCILNRERYEILQIFLVSFFVFFVKLFHILSKCQNSFNYWFTINESYRLWLIDFPVE